jgi:hypothetical protein
MFGASGRGRKQLAHRTTGSLAIDGNCTRAPTDKSEHGPRSAQSKGSHRTGRT